MYLEIERKQNYVKLKHEKAKKSTKIKQLLDVHERLIRP